MRLLRGLGGWVAAPAFLWGAVAFAQGAEPREPAVVWYRGAEGCPEAAEFLALLGTEAAHARVAGAGDRVDFVVTLTAADGMVSGRLERQTSTGTVAIRELADPRCESVAGALALGLELALREPDAAPVAPPVAPPGDAAATARPSDPVTSDARVLSAPASPPPPASPAPTSAPVAPAPPPRRLEGPRWSFDVAAGLTTEQISRPTALAGAFVARQSGEGSLPVRPAFRVGLVGSYGVRATPTENVAHEFLATRLDGCLPPAGGGVLALWPCLGTEVGALRARGTGAAGVAAEGAWAALGVELSLRWRASRRVGLFGTGGLVLPVTRYELYGATELYSTAPVGARLTAGAFFVRP